MSKHQNDLLLSTFSFVDHVDYILKVCSQRVYLSKELRDQGLPLQKLHTTIVLSRLMHALPAWGPLNVELVHKIDGFLKCSFRYGFTSELITIQPLPDSATEDLFCKMKSSNHCLHPLLPQNRALMCLGPEAIRSSYPYVALISIRNFCHQLSF